jgi:dephospho-CoA kinase
MVGTPAAGKSTAAQYLAELGAEWINADLIARQCLSQPEVLDQLSARFKVPLRTENGEVDRAKVADLVFGDDSASRANLRFLESLVHPQTRDRINRRIISAAQTGTQVALLDVPLLFESGWDRSCDAIWCIDATRANRLDRSRKRGWDGDELDRREANQVPIETKYRLSNHVMRNDTTLESLHQNLRRCWDQLARIDRTRETNGAGQPRRHCASDRVYSS